LEKASAFADSAYFSNINGTYEKTMQFADSCRYYLNAHYKSLYPKGRHLMLAEGNVSLTPPEIKWYHDGLNTNYSVILDIRNESAVAALALHQWHLYNYNNRIYTQLFKELSADNSLGEYCRAMQQSQTNKTVGVILLVLLLVSIVPAWYLLYYRHRLYDRFMKDQQRQNDFEMLEDEIKRLELEDNNLHVTNAVLDNCLSTLKHETMYYPSRICQLLDAGDMASLTEVATYYRELYGILSAQAMHQVTPIKLHLMPLQHGIFGDENLVHYLFEILKKQSGEKSLDIQYIPQEGPYVEVHIPMPQLKLTEAEARDLFTPSKEHLPYLLCRQIVRDHGEATNRRGCGIYATLIEGTTNMIITLPSVWRTSK
jgi:cell division protein FtsL